MATDPEVTEVPVPDPADPVAWVSALPVDELPVDELPGVPVALADAEWVGDTEWLGDADPDDVTFGLAGLVSVVLGVDVWLGQPPDGGAVTVCLTAGLCVGLGFGGVLLGVGVGVGVGVVLPLSLGLGEALELSLVLGLLLALVVLAGLVVVLAGLPDRTAGLVFAAAFDGLDEAAGDDEHVEAAVADSSPGELTCDAPVPSCWPPPAPADVDAGLCELLKPDSTVWKIWLRSGGTAASTTPTANTARPTASAGRSIASRQSPDRCGACRAWDGPCPSRSDGAACLVRSSCQRPSRPAQRPSRPARKAAIAALGDRVAVA